MISCHPSSPLRLRSMRKLSSLKLRSPQLSVIRLVKIWLIVKVPGAAGGDNSLVRPGVPPVGPAFQLAASLPYVLGLIFASDGPPPSGVVGQGAVSPYLTLSTSA